MINSDEKTRAAAAALADGLCIFFQTRLQNRFLGFYLLGSLAHGGFNRRYSDIDIAVVSETGLIDSDIEAMRDEAMRLAPDLAAKVSLFWTDRNFSAGRFPPLDRMDYLDHAVPLAEQERIVPNRPTIGAIRDYLCGDPFRNWAKAAMDFAALETLPPQQHKPFLRAFLYAARFAYSWQTGKMASNDTALAYLHREPPENLDLGLLDRALEVRLQAAAPDILFPDRQSLPGLVHSCRHLMKIRTDTK